MALQEIIRPKESAVTVLVKRNPLNVNHVGWPYFFKVTLSEVAKVAETLKNKDIYFTDDLIFEMSRNYPPRAVTSEGEYITRNTKGPVVGWFESTNPHTKETHRVSWTNPHAWDNGDYVFGPDGVVIIANTRDNRILDKRTVLVIGTEMTDTYEIIVKARFCTVYLQDTPECPKRTFENYALDSNYSRFNDKWITI